jgi:hypothetical protein
MICSGYTKVWELGSKELVELDGARGTTLRVTRGTLWLTQEGDPRDIVLEAGDAYTIESGGLTIIEAQEAATVCVLSHHIDEIHVRHEAKAPSGGFRGWLRSVAEGSLSRRWVPRF